MRAILVAVALVAAQHTGLASRAAAQDVVSTVPAAAEPAAAEPAAAEPAVAEPAAAEPAAAEPAAAEPAAAEPAAAEPAAAPVHDPTLMIIGVAAASVGVVGFAVLGATALVERGRLADTCGSACTAAQSASTDALGTTTTVFAGLALAGAVTSLIGIAVMGRPEDDEPAEEREEEIAVALTPTGILVSGRF